MVTIITWHLIIHDHGKYKNFANLLQCYAAILDSYDKIWPKIMNSISGVNGS